MKSALPTILLLATALASPVAHAAEAFDTTPGGAEYRDLKPGRGETAREGDLVTIHFINWLEEKGQRGREIYDTRKQNRKVTFVLGTKRVLPGWNEAVSGMREGGKRLVHMPPELVHGSKGIKGVIPPYARQVYLFEMIEIEARHR